MKSQIPVRLQKEPLLEAVWEIRFAAERDVPTGDVLPGVLYQAVHETYPLSLRLAAADIPRLIAQQDESLRYLPTMRLESPDAPFAVQIGPRVVTVNCRRPYAGWAAFSARVRVILNLLKTSGLVARAERFSLRYIDLLELDPQPSLASLDVSLRLGGYDLSRQPVQVRTEIADGPFTQVLQVATPVDVTDAQGQRLQGTLVDIDTVHLLGEASWELIDERLDAAHDASKRLFFGLLTQDAVERLGPVYD